MADVKLDIAFWNYDRTRALSDRKVQIPGVDAKYHSGSNVAEIFRGMVAEHRYCGTGPNLFPANFQAS